MNTTTKMNSPKINLNVSHLIHATSLISSTPHAQHIHFSITVNLLTCTNTIPQQSLTPQEARLYRLYGRVPSQTHHFAKHLKERKYFDSGDYALSKAGRADSAVGSLHPEPSKIPHPHPPSSVNPAMDKPSFSRRESFSSESVEGIVMPTPKPKPNMKPPRSMPNPGGST